MTPASDQRESSEADNTRDIHRWIEISIVSVRPGQERRSFALNTCG
jgi:hypothetical protein